MSSRTEYFCDICGRHIPNSKTSVDIDLSFGIYPDIRASLDLCAEHLKEYAQLVEKVSQEFQEWLDQRR